MNPDNRQQLNPVHLLSVNKVELIEGEENRAIDLTIPFQIIYITGLPLSIQNNICYHL